MRRLIIWLAALVPQPVIDACYRSRRLRRSLMRVTRPLFTSGATVVRLAGGVAKGNLMELDLRTEKALWLGTYEPWIGDVARRLSSQDVVWDIGAYAGYHTLAFAIRARHIVAVEPDPENRGRLERLVELNELRNVEVVGAAVADREGAGALTRGGVGFGETRLDPAGNIPCPITTLDALLSEYPSPDLVKIDIEGGESAALIGSAELVARVRPTFIIEVHDTEARASVETLREYGYDVRRFGKGVDVPCGYPAGGPEHLMAVPS